PLIFTIVTPPAHGMLSGDAPDLTYTPGEDYNGPDTFTYLVVDESEHSTIATVIISIAPVNAAPVVNAIPNQTWAARSENQFAITAFSDDDGDVLSYTASLAGGADLPAWLSLNGVMGVLSGAPANKHKGSYDLVISVDDGNGGT